MHARSMHIGVVFGNAREPPRRAKFKDAILTLTGTTDSTYAIPVGQDPAHAVDDIILYLTACENEIDGIS